MANIKSGSNGNVANVGSDKRIDSRAITEETETLFAIESRKYVISTGLIAVTANSAIVILTNDGEDNLILSSNALQLFDVVGGSGSGAVVVDANAAEDTGTFSAFALAFNANLGATRPGSFTARKGSSGATFTTGIQQVTGFFESPAFIVANTQRFIIEQGNNVAISVTLPTGTTSANIVWTGSIYEDNSTSIREL